MPALKDFCKDPDSVLDYTIDWGEEWMVSGDEISTSSWSIGTGTKGDTTLATTADSNTTTKATIWLGLGVHGQSYPVTNSIVTAQGREADRTISIVVRTL
jgi:hypothetical protein